MIEYLMIFLNFTVWLEKIMNLKIYIYCIVYLNPINILMHFKNKKIMNRINECLLDNWWLVVEENI